MFNKRGFTLPELIIVISVIAILASIVIFGANIISRTGNAKNVKRWEDVTAIGKAVELYQLDNDALPSDLSNVTVWSNQKQVLCSSAASLTCDGQTRACLVINDSDFLGKYIPALPVDPEKSSDVDTGYYITRTGTNMMTFGACSSYNNEDISYVTKASLATHTSTCGDGEITGDEVCDDGNNDNETQTCGNLIIESGSDYCNSDCSATITLTETCDDGAEACGDGIKQNGTYCNDTCDGTYTVSEACDYTGFLCGGISYSGAVGCTRKPNCTVTCGDCVDACIQ